MSEFLIAHGVELALGLTVVLAFGAVAVASTSAPAKRHAIARSTLVAAWGATVLLCLPLPRPARAEIGRLVLVPPPADVAHVEALPVEFEFVDVTHVTEPIDLDVAVPPPVARPTVDLGPWIARVFLLVAAAIALHVLAGAALLRRTLRRATPPPGAVARAIAAWADPATVLVLASDDAPRPFCCGVRRGVIVLPADLVVPGRERALEVVVRHELAHLAHRHPASRLLASASAPLLYWNPLYWWLARELRRSAESLADDAAAASLDKRLYVSELLSLAERSSPSPAVVGSGALGVGVLGSRRDFLRRMEALLMRKERLAHSTSRRHRFAQGLCTALVVGSVSVAWGHVPQEPQQNPLLEPQQDPLQEPRPVTLPEPVPVAQPEPNPLRLPTETPVLDLTLVADPELSSIAQDLAAAITLQSSNDTMAAALDRIATPPAPRPTTTQLVCVVEVSDAAALGQFVYAASDAGITLLSLELDAREGTRRIARFVVKQGCLPELAAAARSVDGALFVQCKPRRVAVAPAAVTTRPGRPAPTRYVAVDPSLPAPTIAEDAAAVPIRGKVQGVRVSGERRIFEIDRGANDGVRAGTTFEVYSGGRYKGRLRVTEVGDESSKAVVTLRVRKGWITVGDSVATDL